MRDDLKLGIDKSQYEGRWDWAVARNRHIEWVTMRACPGQSTPADPYYAEQSEHALAAGVAVSPYQYYKFRKNAVEQAKFFLSVATHANLPACIDLENYGLNYGYVGVGRAEILPWLEYVEKSTGVRPMIYTSPSFIQSYLTKDTFLSEYPLLLANYKVSAPFIQPPFTPKNQVAWQFWDGRDARYYGALEANGCALYVWDGDLPLKEWQAAPVADAPTVYKSGVVRSGGVRVRSAPSITAAQVDYLAGGTSVSVLETVYEGGNIWVRVGEGRWCAALYNGAVLIDLSI